MRRILTFSDLETINTPAVGLCHGVFDILHYGHVRHLQWAKAQCDVLVVSVTPDKYVDKGPGRPIFPLETRIRMLLALRCVDYVLSSESADAVKVIDTLKPDYYIKGPDAILHPTPALQREIRAVEAYGGTVLYSDDSEEYHTTWVLERIKRALLTSEKSCSTSTTGS